MISDTEEVVMRYTYGELCDMAYDVGNNCAAVAIGRMMDMVEEDTGEFPSWDDEAPEWVVKEVVG